MSLTDLLATPIEVPGYPAVFSPNRAHRYVLWRRFTDVARPRYVMFIGLNPSTADETHNDPTLRRCMGFARDWGYDALCMTNLFAFRATNPKVMLAAPDPIGEDNDQWLIRCSNDAALVIAAWGTNGGARGRDSEVRALVLPRRMHVLGVTNYEFPRHPLYVRADTQPRLWGR